MNPVLPSIPHPLSTPVLPSFQRERQLTAASDSLANIIESAAAPIIALDDEGVVTGWNKAVAAATGIDSALAMGRNLLEDLVHPTAEEVVRRAFRACTKGEWVGGRAGGQRE